VLDVTNAQTAVLIGGTSAVLADRLAPSVHSPAPTCA
jgi:hypothetical protein